MANGLTPNIGSFESMAGRDAIVVGHTRHGCGGGGANNMMILLLLN